MATTGQLIAQFRTKAKLSQLDLALALGLRYANQISVWERGVVEPRADRLRAIAAALGCNAYDLLGEDNVAAK